MAGSVLDVFGGEFEWDRYTVKFHKARGADHNVHIIYGKNLTDFKMEKSIENTITGGASVLGRQRNAGSHGTAGEGGAAKQTVDPLPEDHRAGLYQQFSGKAE